MKVKVLFLTIMLMTFGVSGASAATVSLFDWGFNVNGNIYKPGDSLPAYFNTAGFDFNTGLGIINITYTAGPGSYKITSFFDHEIDEAINTYFNEFGSINGSPASGQSWEIDEPGYGNPITGYKGDIYSNFIAGTLDKKIFDGTFIGPEDVSMAVGWNFTLGSGEYAVITLKLEETQSSSYILQIQLSDPDSSGSVWFTPELEIRGGPGPAIPEPATMLLLGSGLVGLAGLGRKRLFKK